MVSLKKKGQRLGFWSSLPYKSAEENFTQCQGQTEVGLISIADGHVFHRLPFYYMTSTVHHCRMIYKVGLVRHVAWQVKRCFSSTDNT